MEDILLVMRCKRGDREGLRRIYEKYRDELLILAVALCGDADAAEDAVHDTFVRFAETLKDFRLTGSLKGYLATCVANRVRDLMRSKRNRVLKQGQFEHHCSGPDDPSRVISCNEQLERLSSALAKLPDEQRQVVVLRTYSRMRFRAIAESTGASVSTVKGRYRYGISKLRAILDGEVEK